MANPTDNLRRLYQNGLKHFTLPDYDTFQKDMMDEQKRRRFYNNMLEAYTLPDFDTFSQDIGAVTPPAPAQPVAQAQAQPQPVAQAQTTVKPITDTTAQQASVQQPVQTAAQPAQPEGWNPTPTERLNFQFQMEQANASYNKHRADVEQRMEGIKKGNSLGAIMGERELNPQTGQMETHYYTRQGERVGSRMEQGSAIVTINSGGRITQRKDASQRKIDCSESLITGCRHCGSVIIRPRARMRPKRRGQRLKHGKRSQRIELLQMYIGIVAISYRTLLSWEVRRVM